MLSKNKEEIEKIGNGCGKTFDINDPDYITFCGVTCHTQYPDDLNLGVDLCKECRGRYKERIKTSILWCEDEIEFLEKLLWEDTYLLIKGVKLIINKKNKLRTHLTWLKEQEKKNEQE